MILTITANPTIDRILFVRDFAMQDLVRAQREVVSPSGKGLDVSLILHDWGEATHAIALKAGRHGDYLAALVDARGLPVTWIEARGETRMAALVTDVVQQRQSTILAHTLHGDAQTLGQIAQRLTCAGASVWGLVCAGSLPPGLPTDSYTHLLRQAHAQGMVTLLDASGPALCHGVAACPHILKLNRAELAQLAPRLTAVSEQNWGREGRHAIREVATALGEYLGQWAQEAIVVTLGRDGLLAVSAEKEVDGQHRPVIAYYVPALSMPVVSAAGAGDAVSAGLLWARRRGLSWRSAVHYGAAAGAVAVTAAGTSCCPWPAVKRLVDHMSVEQIV